MSQSPPQLASRRRHGRHMNWSTQPKMARETAVNTRFLKSRIFADKLPHHSNNRKANLRMCFWPDSLLVQIFDLLPRIRSSYEPKLLKSCQGSLLSRLVNNLAIFQREYGDTREVHLLARVGLFEGTNSQIAERDTSMSASPNPPADYIGAARNQRVLIRMERDVGECLSPDLSDLYNTGPGQSSGEGRETFGTGAEWGLASLNSRSIFFAASLPYRGPCMG